MQAQIIYRKTDPMAQQHNLGITRSNLSLTKQESHRESIHSGHFMVSDFEAEAQDDEDELAVPVPDPDEEARLSIIAPPGFNLERFISNNQEKSPQQLIETSLNKLFQCMSLAYRQKLTSPKWNRFKGIRLRWKDKIRLNNVIWRCWHMQFILKQSTLVCQFASPLDVDTHNKPEAVVLEGKYWKRKLAAVTAEYKKWRMFHRNKILGCTPRDGLDMLEAMDMPDWESCLGNSALTSGSGLGLSVTGMGGGDMLVDEDYMELMTDTLFSTISSNQPMYFPDTREIARGASLADFIQPSLGPLQPNLDDLVDPLEPLHEFLNSKLPPVPEEDDIFRSTGLTSNYNELDLINSINQTNGINQNTASISNSSNFQEQSISSDVQRNVLSNVQYASKLFTQAQHNSNDIFRNSLSINDNFNMIQTNTYQEQLQINESNRDRNRQSRNILRSPRFTQQQEPNQQQSFQTLPLRSNNDSYQQQPMQNNQGFNINLQIAMPNIPTTLNQIQQIPMESESTLVDSQLPALTQQSMNAPILNYNTNSLRFSKNYKIQNNQPTFKYPAAPNSTYDSQKKFLSSNNPNKQLPVPSIDFTPQQSISTKIIPQNKYRIDLTAPALHPTKLLPKPALNIEKDEVFAIPKYQMKVRSRSRSSSSLSTSKLHPPPLVSAVSDPSLNVNNNALLTHLLTNNSSNLYTITSGPDKNSPSTSQQTTIKQLSPLVIQSQKPDSTLFMNASTSGQGLHAFTTAQNQVSQSNVQAASNGQQLFISSNKILSKSTPNSPKDFSTTQSPVTISPTNSPMSLGSPLSPSKCFKVEPERGQFKEQRRVGHIHAEQKRRYNIKNGFDTLHSLIPQLNQNPNAKMSKAAMLQKGADYIRQLRNERNLLKEEIDSLRTQIDVLNADINNCQAMLPATGAPVSRQRTNKMKEMFDEYVRVRTRENWKFWIFSILLEPLMVSFNAAVSTASIEELYRSTLLWVDQHCSLVDLRPAVLNSLRYLCTATDILNDPSRLPEEALAAVNKNVQRKNSQ